MLNVMICVRAYECVSCCECSEVGKTYGICAVQFSVSFVEAKDNNKKIIPKTPNDAHITNVVWLSHSTHFSIVSIPAAIACQKYATTINKPHWLHLWRIALGTLGNRVYRLYSMPLWCICFLFTFRA